MKILLSAFACCPLQGSEEGVGWGVAVNLALRHRVHVLTTPRFRAAIEGYLAAHPALNLTFSYFDVNPVVRRCIVHTALWQIYYYAWQMKIAGWSREVVERFDPDLIHHITYGRYWTPSSMWKLGKPFIWGPLGGGDKCPPQFFRLLSAHGRWSERIRTLAQLLARSDPALLATARHCALAFAGTPETEKCLQRLGCARVTVFLPNAVEPDFFASEETNARQGALFCTVGRLLDWKGQALAIRAFALAKIPGSRLMIIGEGSTLAELQKLATKLKVDEQVSFLGALSREEVRQWLRRSVALVHPSLHDQAPTVVMEAMAVGTPVIGLALGGITLQVTAECGILIPPVDPEQTLTDLAEAMCRLAGNPELRRKMGEAGLRRMAAEFTWAKKTARFEAFYETVVGAGVREPLNSV